MQSLDWKELTNDRNATGIESAWAIVISLAEAWTDLNAAITTLRTAVERD
jgi:hypothetical protein